MMISLIRELDATQLQYFAQLMADAFFDYPLYTFSIPDERTRRKALPQLFSTLLRFSLKFGKVYKTDDDQAVSLWLPPLKSGITSLEFMRNGGTRFVLDAGVKSALRLGRLIDQTIVNRNNAGKSDCWYLYIIAVHSNAQGKGLGKRLVRGACQSIQPANGIWLETCKRRNADIYASLGFKFCFIEGLEGTPIQTHGMFAEAIT